MSTARVGGGCEIAVPQPFRSPSPAAISVATVTLSLFGGDVSITNEVDIVVRGMSGSDGPRIDTVFKIAARLLSSSSPVFGAMIGGAFKEGAEQRIVIEQFSAADVGAFLQCLCHDALNTAHEGIGSGLSAAPLPLNASVVLRISPIADFFQCSCLLGHIVEYVQLNATLELALCIESLGGGTFEVTWSRGALDQLLDQVSVTRTIRVKCESCPLSESDVYNGWQLPIQDMHTVLVHSNFNVTKREIITKRLSTLLRPQTIFELIELCQSKNGLNLLSTENAAACRVEYKHLHSGKRGLEPTARGLQKRGIVEMECKNLSCAHGY